MIDNLLITNQKHFDSTLAHIRKDGAKCLHVLADFDRTLTKIYVDGKEVPSIISVLRDNEYLSNNYAERAHELANYYLPISNDTKMPLKEKAKFMSEWWQKHFDLFVECKLNINDIKRVATSGKIQLREGSKEFFDLLRTHNIPLVIISASGLGVDSIRLLLEHGGFMSSNIFIVSNRLKWGADGNFTEAEKPYVHCANKDETVLNAFSFFDQIEDRKNVLLLGDNADDVEMVSGFEYDNLLKIGFLKNDDDRAILEHQKVYDALILDDGSISPVSKIII